MNLALEAVPPATPYVLAAAGIIGIAVYGVLTADHLLRKLLSLNLLGSGVFLLLVTLPAQHGRLDPMTHALVLTGLVVAVSVTAFALALLDRLYRETGEIRVDSRAPDRSAGREEPRPARQVDDAE
jgi:multicomponent Na+:H+ antiporter subunit C